MSTRPSPAYKRATDSFYQIWGNFKQNVSQQSQLKGAIYNLVIASVVASVVAACLVLGPFLRPLLWALLVGAVLFPFKYTLSSSLKSWFDRLEQENTHLLVGIMLVPLESLEAFGQYLWSSIVKHMHLLIGGCIGLTFLRLFIAYAPKGIFCVLWRYIRWWHELCSNFLSSLDYKIVSNSNDFDLNVQKKIASFEACLEYNNSRNCLLKMNCHHVFEFCLSSAFIYLFFISIFR